MASRAVHIEIVSGYSTDDFLLGLSRFGHLRGWPQTIQSDPGSQLVGADKVLVEAWKKLDLEKVVSKCFSKGTEWKFSPADSPHYQGLVESLIRTVKRTVKTVYGHNQRLSYPEYCTLGYAVADMVNSRPIGVASQDEDVISVLTPNSLILGRNSSSNPRCYPEGRVVPRLTEVNSIVKQFWKTWVSSCKPALILHRKWNAEVRNLLVGDVVLVLDKDSLTNSYRVAKVTEATPSDDGKVRSVKVMYKRYKREEEGTLKYTGGSSTEVTRSVQNLVLLVPIDELKAHSNDYA